jgi:hypothetical protein
VGETNWDGSGDCHSGCFGGGGVWDSARDPDEVGALPDSKSGGWDAGAASYRHRASEAPPSLRLQPSISHDGFELQLCTIEDITAEKLRSLLQQVTKGTPRKQDVLDLAMFLQSVTRTRRTPSAVNRCSSEFWRLSGAEVPPSPVPHGPGPPGAGHSGALRLTVSCERPSLMEGIADTP